MNTTRGDDHVLVAVLRDHRAHLFGQSLPFDVRHAG